MNKQRRKVLRDICERLDAIRDEVEGVKDEEEAAYDNLPDGLRDGVQCTLMSENVDSLQEAIDGLEEVYDKIDTAAAC